MIPAPVRVKPVRVKPVRVKPVRSSHPRATRQRQRTLIAIVIQRLLDRFLHAFVNTVGAAEVTLSLLRHARLQMTRSRLTMLGLAAGGQTKTLLGPFVSLLLGHDTIQPAFKFVDNPRRVTVHAGSSPWAVAWDSTSGD